tara:strand:- start:30106 stop:30711 length:606 start_codon:yes stop_codon:yes gene_type:complete
VPKSHYQSIACIYDILDYPFEILRYQQIRRLVFEGLTGHLIDVGVGTGRNIRFYPRNTQVIGIDNSINMLRHAVRRKKYAKNNLSLVEMDAQELGFNDKSFDFAVLTFICCTMDPEHQMAVLNEVYRILKPGGKVLILDYTYSSAIIRRLIMKIWAPWVNFAYGARFDRKVNKELISRIGFRNINLEYVYSDSIILTKAEK